jgi:hypothetical protein
MRAAEPIPLTGQLIQCPATSPLSRLIPLFFRSSYSLIRKVVCPKSRRTILTKTLASEFNKVLAHLLSSFLKMHFDSKNDRQNIISLTYVRLPIILFPS